MTDTASAQVRIEDDDEALRWLFSSRDVALGGLGRLDLGNSLQFPSEYDKKESFHCKALVKDFPSDIHNGGTAKANNDNTKRKTPIAYEGFTVTRVEGIRSISAEGHYFEITHEPVSETYSHCDVTLHGPEDFNKGLANKLKRKLCDLLESSDRVLIDPTPTTAT